MPLIIVPADTLPNSSSGGGSSSDGHSHSNITTLNKLYTDNNGNLCFNGKIVGENAIETACNFTLTEAQVSQKFIALPHDCDTSRVITLSLNGVAFARGDCWEVDENVNYTNNDFIAWNGLGLEHFAQVGDLVLITYYKKI